MSRILGDLVHSHMNVAPGLVVTADILSKTTSVSSENASSSSSGPLDDTKQAVWKFWWYMSPEPPLTKVVSSKLPTFQFG